MTVIVLDISARQQDIMLGALMRERDRMMKKMSRMIAFDHESEAYFEMLDAIEDKKSLMDLMAQILNGVVAEQDADREAYDGNAVEQSS